MDKTKPGGKRDQEKTQESETHSSTNSGVAQKHLTGNCNIQAEGLGWACVGSVRAAPVSVSSSEL